MKIDTIYNENSIDSIKKIETESVHLILSDIPYGISFADWDILHENTNSALGGSSPAQHKTGSGFKMRGKPINGWSEADRKIPLEYQNWVESWAKEWFRVLKPGSSCFIFAGRRYAHRAIVGLENSGFTFRDMIGWNRSKATLKAQRISKVYERRNDFENAEKLSEWRVGNLRPVFEPILWFTKPYKQGGTIADNMLKHGVGAYNLEKWQTFSEKGDNYIEIPNLSSDRGLHPTQKPLVLMKALIELTTQENQIVLDPFSGSGTTLVAANELNRHYLGFEIDKDYYNTSLNRLNTLL